MKSPLYVIKIGGNIIKSEASLQTCLQQILQLQGRVVLVHGGGKLLDELATKLQLPQTMLEGRRITDAPTRDLALMVYAGYINKRVVAYLTHHGRTALGLTGADAALILARKRSATPIDFGLVGDVVAERINTTFLNVVLAMEMIPVFSSITLSDEGELLNTNADSIAAGVACALAHHYYTTLVYCFEKRGVLRDLRDEYSVIPEMRPADFESLKSQGIISEGMLPKLHNAFQALNQGVAEVVITKEDLIHEAINRKNDAGTRLYA